MNTPALCERLATALVENRPSATDTDPLLRDVLAMTTGNPGKLVRARLVYAGALTQGLDEAAAAGLACAVEYFHVASLLFDDLPCMDDAGARRGLPCAHRLHGEAATVLGALALINRAYALIGFSLAGHPVHLRLQATACIDASLGLSGLVGGQARDLNFGATDRSARSISRIAAAKTGSLFWLAVYFPGLLAEPNAVERRALKSLCVYWGLAFQAADDLQDALGGSVDSGKTAGRDHVLDRPNLAHALGVPATRHRIGRLMIQSQRALAGLMASRPERWSYLLAFHVEFSTPITALANAAQAA